MLTSHWKSYAQKGSVAMEKYLLLGFGLILMLSRRTTWARVDRTVDLQQEDQQLKTPDFMYHI